MNLNLILKKYNVNYEFKNGYYYINGEAYYIVEAQEVNNEPDNLRVQTGNKEIQKVISAHVNDRMIQPKLWVIYPLDESCLVAEFDNALDDKNLLDGNKSLKFKKSEFGLLGTVNRSSMMYESKLFHLYLKMENIELFDDEINIQPDSDIYSFFKNLSYKTWYALSEFVDNSTASYLDKNHQTILNQLDEFGNLKIEISYNKVAKELIVKDNAYGMEISDFKRAFRLKEPPLDTSGRNEFGMGLKTAAFWFGRKLTVTSTEYGSNNQYSLTLDTEVLDREKLKKLKITTKKVPASTHGTTVIIGDIYPERDISNGSTKKRIENELSTIYRRDLLGVNLIDPNRPVEIYFYDRKLPVQETKYIKIYPKMYDYYSRFLEKNPDFKYSMKLSQKKMLFKKFKFSVEHNGVFHHVKCIIGYLNKTGAANAGFILYRRGRVIEGSVGKFLKPVLIFGAPNSFESQRLFGEIDLDDLPVSQAKDSFMWSEELQDKIYQKIRDRILDLQYLVRNFSKSDKLPEGHEVLNSNPTKIIKEINQSQEVKSAEELEKIDEKNNFERLNLIKEELRKRKVEYDESYAQKLLDSKKTEKESEELYTFDGIRYKVKFVNMNEYIKVKESKDESYHYLLEINISHNFFSKFINNEDFIQIITELALAIVTAEFKFSEDKKIQRYRKYINKFISNKGGGHNV